MKKEKRGWVPELKQTYKQRHSVMHEELLIWYFLCDPHQRSSTGSGELLLLPLFGLIADDILAADQNNRKTDRGAATASGY